MNFITNANNIELAIDLELQSFSHNIPFRCDMLTIRVMGRNPDAHDHSPLSDSIVFIWKAT